MNVLSSLNLGTSFSRSGLFKSFQGLMNSSKQHQKAAQNIVDDTISGLNSTATRDIANVSGVNITISEHSNLESDVLELNQAGLTYTANARLVKATSTIYDALFRAVA